MIKTWMVYVHISPSNKIYVGITSKKPAERWKNGNGYKACVRFNNAIKKYGWDNFQHEIVATNLFEQEAKNFEKVLIEKLNSNNPSFGYNLTKGGDGVLGLKHTDEWKEKHRELMLKNNPFKGIPKEKHPHYGRTGAKHPMYGLPRELHSASRKVKCITTDEIFVCVRSGAEKYKTYGSDINKCCTGRLKSAGKSPTGEKLTWCYVDGD